MKLQTEVTIPTFKDLIDYSSSISMLGSCFSVNIAKKLADRKFTVNFNPLGTIYNPLSIANTLNRIENKKHVSSKELFFNNGVWGHFDFNTTFSNTNQTIALTSMNEAIDRAHESLTTSNFLILTLGTSFCYFKQSDSLPVSNCHKLPSNSFTRRMIPHSETTQIFKELLSSKAYQSKNIIFTVSPIRHIKDGLTSNTISKSHLLIAIDSLCAELKNASYFPSYEIFNDELRDYRYYDTDMLHPSQTGIEYIWDKFSNAIISPNAKNTMKEVESIVRDFNHRPINPNSSSFQTFKENLIIKASTLEKKFKSIDFSKEKEIINNFGNYNKHITT